MSARVIITGASSGIGAATAAELRTRGTRVVGLDLSGGEGEILACDVRDQASVDRAVAEAVSRLGGLDVLINNAGIGDSQSAGDRPDEDALNVIDVNMLGPWRVTAAALPALRASHGRVINVASGLAHLPMPMATAYCMSKRGLVAYSDALRPSTATPSASPPSTPATSAPPSTTRRGRRACRSRGWSPPSVSKTRLAPWPARRWDAPFVSWQPAGGAASPTRCCGLRRARWSTAASTPGSAPARRWEPADERRRRAGD